jgi:hypothetical protein
VVVVVDVEVEEDVAVVEVVESEVAWSEFVGAGIEDVAPVVAPASSMVGAAGASDDTGSAAGPRLSTLELHAAITGTSAASQIIVRRVITCANRSQVPHQHAGRARMMPSGERADV